MALRESFNQFTDKIVSQAEYDAKVAALGISREESIAFLDKLEEMRDSGQLDEISTLMKEVEHAGYLTSKDAAKIEEAVMATENEVFAQMALEDALQASPSYCKILPALKLAAFVAPDDEKLLNAFTKAAQECTDYSDKIADMQEMQSAINGIVKKASAKFGL
jgi:hypothetical protein